MLNLEILLLGLIKGQVFKFAKCKAKSFFPGIYCTLVLCILKDIDYEKRILWYLKDWAIFFVYLDVLLTLLFFSSCLNMIDIIILGINFTLVDFYNERKWFTGTKQLNSTKRRNFVSLFVKMKFGAACFTVNVTFSKDRTKDTDRHIQNLIFLVQQMMGIRVFPK